VITVFQRLDRLARNLWPFVLSLLLVIVSVLPLQLPDFGRISPNLAVMATFYWAIYRPDLFPAPAAFLLGLWLDLLTGSPVGINALVLLLVHWAILSQRRFFQGKSFGVVWWAFALTLCGAMMLFWLLSAVYFQALIDPSPLVFQFLVTISCFPFLTWLLARTQHFVMPQG